VEIFVAWWTVVISHLIAQRGKKEFVGILCGFVVLAFSQQFRLGGLLPLASSFLCKGLRGSANLLNTSVQSRC
jgi:hypothetical protein